jgi:hypothetical protein
MACYLAAERGERLAWPPAGLDDFVPAVQRETWSPKSALRGKR